MADQEIQKGEGRGTIPQFWKEGGAIKLSMPQKTFSFSCFSYTMLSRLPTGEEVSPVCRVLKFAVEWYTEELGSGCKIRS